MLHRARLLGEYLGQARQYQYIFIEAQAGQGKTTTAIQLLSQLEIPYIWYQIGKEDRDPLFFLTALLRGLVLTVPNFSCPHLTSLLNSGEVTPADSKVAVNLLLTELSQALSTEFTFVFDDLHLLADAEQSLTIIDCLLETAPPNISFILLSRKPVPFTSRRLRYGSSTLYLSNEDLAFSEQETRELLEILLGRTPEEHMVSTLAAQTGGWVMGLILSARASTNGQSSAPDLSGESDSHMHLAYVEEELFNQLNEKVQQILIKLSLVDEINVTLAREISGVSEIRATLLQLMEENYFIRSLDDEATLFSIHHLFRSLLRNKAKQLLAPDEYRDTLLKIGSFYLEQGEIQKSMHVLLMAEDYTELEDLFATWGMELIFMNRQVTLANLLQKIPPENVEASAWFSFFSGLVLQQTDPSRSKTLLLQARALFQERQDLCGELLTLGELVYFYIVLSPDENQCTGYLDRGNVLFEQCGTELTAFCQASTAKNLGTGCFYFLNDFKRAKEYSLLAEAAVLKTGSLSQLVEILASRGFVHLYLGEFKNAEDICGRIQLLLNTSTCGLRGLLAGYYIQLQVLHLQGNYWAYQRLKQTLLKKVTIQSLRKTIIYAYITLYDISIATAGGEPGQVRELIDNHQDKGIFAAVPHLRNEMLAMKVLALAESGRFIPEGQELAEGLLPETQENKTPSYRMKLLLPLSLAYGLAGDMEQACQLINQGVELAQHVQVYPYEMYGRIIRALITILEGDEESARGDLEFGLKGLQKLQTHHIYYISSPSMLLLFKAAARLNIQRDLVQSVASATRNLAVLDDGSTLPQLYIQTLGKFAINREGREVAGGDFFTIAQRQILGLIITNPQLQISLENAQFILWPDSSPAKARNRLDALLSRLRITFSALVPGYSVKKYLVLEKGILSLRHCRIDAHVFMDHVRQGLAFGREEKWWQAGNRLNQAVELWRGAFVADLLPGGQSYLYGDHLISRLTDIGLAWCPVMAENGLQGKAIRIATEIQQSNPTDERLAKMLYKLYLLSEHPLRASKFYSCFAGYLQKNGYPQDEIEQALSRMVSCQG